MTVSISSTFVLGAITGAIIALGYGFLKGFSQHIGKRAARDLIELVLSSDKTNFSDQELYDRTMELHSELSEFQSRKERRRSRQFWNNAHEEADAGDAFEKHKQMSVVREEMKGEFLKKFAPQLEMILQEYEKREIEPDDDHMDFDSLRFWAQQGEVSRVLPSLRQLSQKLEAEK